MACQGISFINILVILLALLSSCCCLGSYATGRGDTTSGIQSRSVILSVERKLICAEYGESLNISCSLTAAKNVNKSSVDAWSLSWRSDGKSLRANETVTVTNNLLVTSCLRIHVSWYDEKVFTCVGSRSSEAGADGPQQVLNISVVVRIKPRPTNIIGVRFIETSRGQTVETFWKPFDLTSVDYTLKYCLVDSGDGLSPICPHYRSVTSECLFRQLRDYYGVPRTNGMTCKASLSYGKVAPIFVEYKLYVVSYRARCESEGSVRKFELEILPFEKVDPTSDPNQYTLVMIPHHVTNFHVVVTKQRTVRLTWSEPSFVYHHKSRKYSVDYNCSKNRTITRRGLETNMTLHSVDFHPYRPYALCHFCVKARISDNSVFSESVCTATRLHEEVPSAAPEITCAEDNCETADDGVERNVTITWSLPPREAWNGVLLNVTVIYRRGDNRSRNVEPVKVPERNLTKGATVLRGLDSNSTYTIQMVACNQEGCSGVGNAMAISRMDSAQSSAPAVKLSQQSAETNIAVILAGSIGGAAVLVILLFIAGIVTRSWVKRRKARRGSLPSIHEPGDYDNVGAYPRTDMEYAVVKGKEHAPLDVIGENGNLKEDEPQHA